MRGNTMIGAGIGFLVAAFLAVFLAGPLVVVLEQGLDRAYLLEVVRNPVLRAGLGNAFAVATVTTTIVLAISVPLAWLASRYRFRGRTIAEALLLAPLVLPPFVGALGIYQLLGEYGIVNSLLADLGLCGLPGPDWMGHHRFAIVCAVEALGLYPMLYLMVAASFRRIDISLLEAARAAGASRFQAFWRVALPQARPALFGGGVIVFVWSFTELGTPLMLGYNRITAVQVWSGLNEINSNRLPFALVLVMLAISAGIYLLGRALFARRFDTQVSRGGSGSLEQPIAGARAAAAWIPFALVALVAMTPHLVVMLVGVSRDWYATVVPSGLTFAHVREALSHPQVVPGIVNSIEYSVLATVLSLFVGVFIAWCSVRWRPPGWQILDVAAMVPLAVPGIIFAFGYLGLASMFPGMDPTKNPGPILVIAYAIRRLPQVVRASAAGLSQSPVALEEAAAVAGASRATTLYRITLPLIAASLAAGALLTFSSSMLEVSDSMVLAQSREHWPITRVIFDLLNALGSGPAVACAFAAWAMLFLVACLASASVLLGRGLGSIFRD